METELLTERYAHQISGTLSCYDRIMIQGTLHPWCYADGMTRFLSARRIKIFDYTQLASSLRDQVTANAQRLATENGLEIDYIRKKNFRKEDKVKQILKKRGTHPGLVWIFSALEPCTKYYPWLNRQTGNTYLRSEDAKCLHYYFYFIDPQLGLCYVRVPTWCPFRLQFYCNGHSWLARRLEQEKISHQLQDNAFVFIDNFQVAQKIADTLPVHSLHRKLDGFAQTYCPVIQHFSLTYHWSIQTAEYALDIVFDRQQTLQAIYSHLIRTAIHTVKPDNIATFLGRKLHGNFNDEMGNRYNIRMEGTRIRHSMGPVSIKMYDKFCQILRIETTVNDISFFKHYRQVEQKDGTPVHKYAPMRKTIYSLPPLRDLLKASNRRYLEFISSIEERTAAIQKLTKISRTIVDHQHSYPGFNLFDDQDQLLLETIARGEFNISGFQNKSLRPYLDKTTGSVSRILKRLRLHGLIKKVGRSYKYYLTALGRQVIAVGLKLKQLVVIPELTRVQPC